MPIVMVDLPLQGGLKNSSASTRRRDLVGPNVDMFCRLTRFQKHSIDSMASYDHKHWARALKHYLDMLAGILDNFPTQRPKQPSTIAHPEAPPIPLTLSALHNRPSLTPWPKPQHLVNCEGSMPSAEK